MVGIEIHLRQGCGGGRGRAEGQGKAQVGGVRLESGHLPLHEGPQVVGGGVELHLSGFEAGHVEELVDEGQQAAAVAVHQAQLGSQGCGGRGFEQLLQRPENEGKRSAQLVADIGEEAGFQLVALGERFGSAQAGLQFGVSLLQGLVGSRLGGFLFLGGGQGLVEGFAALATGAVDAVGEAKGNQQHIHHRGHPHAVLGKEAGRQYVQHPQVVAGSGDEQQPPASQVVTGRRVAGPQHHGPGQQRHG